MSVVIFVGNEVELTAFVALVPQEASTTSDIARNSTVERMKPSKYLGL